jgi:hypothetical protein
MATDGMIEATYKVRYYIYPPEIPPQDDGLPKMDYTQAINVASVWMQDGREIEIYDDSTCIILVIQKGAEFITFNPNHAHFQEHLKIKIAPDKLWGEIWSKRFRL